MFVERTAAIVDGQSLNGSEVTDGDKPRRGGPDSPNDVVQKPQRGGPMSAQGGANVSDSETSRNPGLMNRLNTETPTG